MPKAPRILLTGGGSGGHITPNLAIAAELKRKKANVKLLYVGSHYVLDAEIVKKSGIPFRRIYTGKIRRYFSLRNFIDPFLVILGFLQSFFILLKFRPNVVMAKGGFVSFPVAFTAWVMRIPVVLHESDRSMGIANRLIAKISAKNCVAFEDVRPTPKNLVYTGNPVRESIFGGSKEAGYKFTGFIPEKPVLLVWGGSLGAEQINNLLFKYFDSLKDTFQVVHITGKSKGVLIKDSAYKAFEYVDDELKDIYAITDISVGRSGANSIFELAEMQIPSVLIPLKQNADQMLNAEYFENKKASVILRDENEFTETLEAMWNNKPYMESMRASLGTLSKKRAASKIADIIFSL